MIKLGLGPGIYRDGADVRALAQHPWEIAFFMDEGLKAAHLFRNCLRIGRYYYLKEQQYFGSDVQSAYYNGRYLASATFLRANRDGVWDEIEVWTSYCEANADNDGSFTWEKQWAFSRGFAERMHELAKKVCEPNNSVGTGEVADFQTSEALASLAVMDYHGSHDYGPDGPDLMALDDGWYTRGWQMHAQAIQDAGHRFPPHISTECGVYGNKAQPTGWKGVYGEPVIIEDFRWLRDAMAAHPLWEGACLYLTGTPDPAKWQNWDYLGTNIIAAIAEMNATQRGDADVVTGGSGMPTSAQLDRLFNSPLHRAWFDAGGWKYVNNHARALDHPDLIGQTLVEQLADLKEAASAAVEQANRLPKV